ncbi:MAG: lysylphosphatidylglycerol synthase domain-containing protein [Planctomycetaceae bacterium]
MSESLPAQRAAVSWKPLLKWLLFTIVLIFVAKYGYRQWQQMDFSAVRWEPQWLFVAIVLYFIGWIPSAWAWWWLLHAAGQRIPFYPALRAHYCGHLGKYAPGKALALIIRAAMVREHGVSAAFAALLGTVETLVTMATGLLVLIALLPLVLALGDASALVRLFPVLKMFLALSFVEQTLVSLGVLLLAILAAPLSARVLTRLVRRISRRYNIPIGPAGSPSDAVLKLNTRTLLICRHGSDAACWVVNGLSLGCVLAGMGLPPTSLLDPLLWICAVAGPLRWGSWCCSVPGGLGVREAVLVALLQISPGIDASVGGGDRRTVANCFAY